MPRVIETTVYKYEELSDKAKAKARDWYRELASGDNDFADHLTGYGGDFENVARFMGFTIDNARNRKGALSIYWTGFWSQGDGLCFTGTWTAREVDVPGLKKWAPEDKALHELGYKFARLADSVGAIGGHVTQGDRHYCHEFTVRPELDCDLEDGSETPKEDQDVFRDIARKLMRWMYARLEEAYEYSVSDEAVTEAIVANEYEFLESGKRA